jgi:hypothetical protein
MSPTAPTTEAECVEILLMFFREVEPAQASKDHIERIVATFRQKGAADAENGTSWCGQLFGQMASQYGIDPRKVRKIKDAKLAQKLGQPAFYSCTLT